MTEVQIRLIQTMQDGIPLTEEPFGDIARQVGITEDELFRQLAEWKTNGTIRRFGAILRHHRAGYVVNAMGAWNVPDDRAEAFGRTAADSKSVSHCYQRPRFEGFRFNLYTMIHGKSREECEAVARAISGKTGITDYELLYTTTEFKKSSPVYFATHERRVKEPPDA